MVKIINTTNYSFYAGTINDVSYNSILFINGDCNLQFQPIAMNSIDKINYIKINMCYNIFIINHKFLFE